MLMRFSQISLSLETIAWMTVLTSVGSRISIGSPVTEDQRNLQLLVISISCLSAVVLRLLHVSRESTGGRT
jgi:hypothetical protein